MLTDDKGGASVDVMDALPSEALCVGGWLMGDASFVGVSFEDSLEFALSIGSCTQVGHLIVEDFLKIET